MMRYIFAIFFALLAAPASTDSFDGNKMYEYCAINSPGEMICLGYIAAIVDVYRRVPIGGFEACMPDGVRLSQLRDIVAKFLRDHPEDRHYGASDIVSFSLQQAYPCK